MRISISRIIGEFVFLFHKKPRNKSGLKIRIVFVFFASAGLTLFNVFGLAFKATPSDVPFTRLPIWGGVTLRFFRLDLETSFSLNCRGKTKE